MGVRIGKAFAGGLAFVAALYLCFRYIGDFSNNQSIVLALVSGFGYGLYEKLNLSLKSDHVFTPYCVTVHPNWHKLLSDFKLIRQKEDWTRLYEVGRAIPASTFNVFSRGVLFTVIKPPSSDSTPPGLVFWDNRKLFLNDLEIIEQILDDEDPSDSEHIRPIRKHKFFDHPHWPGLPGFVFKWGRKGYEIGLEVHLDWWQELCKTGELKELAKTEQRKDSGCGSTRLIVATLPYSEFEVYYQAVDYANQQKLEAQRDKQLETNGWERKSERGWSHVEHKYFRVSHRNI